jgi:hypothetical protein
MRDAIGNGHFRHLLGRLERIGAIVNSKKNVTVNINHVEKRIAYAQDDDNETGSRAATPARLASGVRRRANEGSEEFPCAENKQDARENSPQTHGGQSDGQAAAKNSANEDTRNNQQAGSNVHLVSAIVGDECEQAGRRNERDEARPLRAMLPIMMKKHEQRNE